MAANLPGYFCHFKVYVGAIKSGIDVVGVMWVGLGPPSQKLSSTV